MGSHHLKRSPSVSRSNAEPMLVADRLETWFSGCPSAAVALSGGVDSSLVAYLAQVYLGQENTTAFIADSPSLKRRDLELAIQFCEQHELRFELLHTQELSDPEYASNPTNRCYFCKSTLYSEMMGTLPNDGSVWILNGTNSDDLGDYRPGLQAGSEHGVRSPLAECGVDKLTVRDLARHFGLRCWDKPASPCLSSRIPYGRTVSVSKLRQIEEGEALLESIGFGVARVRHYDDRAVVEVESHRVAALREALPILEPAFLRLGFESVELDAEGFVSGKLNRGLHR